jgi:hypothetical protein
MLELNAARKKARLLIAEPPRPGECNTCGQIPRDDHRTICGLCGCKNSTIDTSRLDLSGHRAVNQVPFGKDSLKDSDYQQVLSMLPEDMVHDFCSYFVRDCTSGNVSMTKHHLNLLDTKQITRKLAALRRKELEAKKTANMHHMRTQLKAMKEQVTAFEKKCINSTM